jgi:uncharacterized protein YbjT (DUF2867 family)
MIVVTAPTGRIGSKLLPLLAAQPDPLRIIARDPEKLAPADRERAELVAGSHRDPETVGAAFAGADTLFWLMPADRTATSPYEAYVTASIPAADAVVRHGVRRVVIVSALGRGTQLYGGHISASHAMEDLFRSTGAHVRALAMPSFMDNFLWQVPALAKGFITGTLPADLRLPWVATKDIASVAARYLLDHEWTGQQSVAVPGPEDLSLNDIAATLTAMTGRTIRLEPGDRERDLMTFVERGYSPAMAQGLLDMEIAAERGINALGPDVSRAETPTTFRRFAEESIVPALHG